MKVELIEYTPNPVMVIEKAASVCYDSIPSSDGKIMKQCYSSGHLSVLEHASFTFLISGVSRALTHQLVRHRTAKFSQRSQRYVKEQKPEYVIPKSIEKNEFLKKEYEEFMENIWDKYNYFISNDIEAEDARYVLPNACTSTICVTMDCRNLLHFMNERLCTCAQWEIRELASQMKKCLMEKDDCKIIAGMCVPKCEAGKIKYCSEPPKRSCGRQPLAKQIIDGGKNEIKIFLSR